MPKVTHTRNRKGVGENTTAALLFQRLCEGDTHMNATL